MLVRTAADEDELRRRHVLEHRRPGPQQDVLSLLPGEPTRVDIPLLPEDYVFAAGHRIGVVVLGSYSGYPSVGEQNRAAITVRYPQSRIVLPVVGGRNAARAAGLG